MNIQCPVCGSKRIALIKYGHLPISEELERAVAREEFYPGGCCISEYSPTHHCFACGKDFLLSPDYT